MHNDPGERTQVGLRLHSPFLLYDTCSIQGTDETTQLDGLFHYNRHSLVFRKTRHSPDRRSSSSLHPPQMTPVLTDRFFGGSEISFSLEDVLTPVI